MRSMMPYSTEQDMSINNFSNLLETINCLCSFFNYNEIYSNIVELHDYFTDIIRNVPFFKDYKN